VNSVSKRYSRELFPLAWCLFFRWGIFQVLIFTFAHPFEAVKMWRLAKISAPLTGVLLVGWSHTCLCQSQPVQISPQFEVASVKPSDTDSSQALVQALPGKLVMHNFLVRTLIMFAYDVQAYQISGGPAWIHSSRFEIQAEADGKVSVKQMEGPMLQALLEDRFKLVTHREIRQVNGYELVPTHGAAKLIPTGQNGCVPYSIESPPSAPSPGQPPPIYCGYPRYGANGLNRTLDGKGLSIANLTNALSRAELHRPVVDKTGLTGTYDVHLEWTTDPPSGPAIDSADGVSIFTALPEQLGLKLRSAEINVEVLVIDRVDKPSPD
jgi:uncharacterized protein (TIGR03435 family)